MSEWYIDSLWVARRVVNVDLRVLAGGELGLSGTAMIVVHVT